MVAGVVLGFYGWWEVQVLLRDDIDANNPFVEASLRVSTRLESWIVDVGGSRFGLATAFVLVAVLLWLLRRNIPWPYLWGASAVVAVGYAVSEGRSVPGRFADPPGGADHRRHPRANRALVHRSGPLAGAVGGAGRPPGGDRAVGAAATPRAQAPAELNPTG